MNKIGEVPLLPYLVCFPSKPQSALRYSTLNVGLKFLLFLLGVHIIPREFGWFGCFFLTFLFDCYVTEVSARSLKLRI